MQLANTLCHLPKSSRKRRQQHASCDYSHEYPPLKEMAIAGQKPFMTTEVTMGLRKSAPRKTMSMIEIKTGKFHCTAMLLVSSMAMGSYRES